MPDGDPLRTRTIASSTRSLRLGFRVKLSRFKAEFMGCDITRRRRPLRFASAGRADVAALLSFICVWILHLRKASRWFLAQSPALVPSPLLPGVPSLSCRSLSQESPVCFEICSSMLQAGAAWGRSRKALVVRVADVSTRGTRHPSRVVGRVGSGARARSHWQDVLWCWSCIQKERESVRSKIG